MEDIDDHEELLNLSLGIVSNYDRNKGINRLKKRKRDQTLDKWEEGCEGKVYALLQMREAMLKTEITYRGTKEQNDEDGHGLHLIHLLLIAATAVNENNMSLALENLNELYQSASLSGDSAQRVVAYFTDGLSARLLTRKSPFYDMITKKPSEEEEFRAVTDLYRVSPYHQFAHFTANQAIIEAFERDQEERSHRALHVIDFDISYGFQWPSLMQSLSEKATSSNRISLRITAFGRNLEELQETENRLVMFSKGFKNLVFEFQGLLVTPSKILNLRKKKHETVAVNLVFQLISCYTRTQVSEILNCIHTLKPSILTLLEQDGRPRAPSFLSRFMESLHYYAAMFDSLDDCLPLESLDRLNIEKNHLGREIKWILNHDQADDNTGDMRNRLKYDKLETWKARMEGHGFAGIKMSSKCLMQAKLLLKTRAQHGPLQLDGKNGGFRVIERDEGKALSLGWQDRSLITASAWQPVL